MPTQPANPDRTPGHPGQRIELRPGGALTVRDAALVLGISPQAIRKWLDRGCPHVPGTPGRDGAATIRMMDVIRWREAEAVDGLDQDGERYDEGRAKAADWHYRAIIRQATARRELGSLVAVDMVADAVEEDYQRVRSRLNSIPARLSVQVAAESDASTVRSMIERAIREALSNLTSGDAITKAAGGDPAASVHDPIRLDIAEDGEAAPDPAEDDDA